MTRAKLKAAGQHNTKGGTAMNADDGDCEGLCDKALDSKVSKDILSHAGLCTGSPKTKICISNNDLAVFHLLLDYL